MVGIVIVLVLLVILLSIVLLCAGAVTVDGEKTIVKMRHQISSLENALSSEQAEVRILRAEVTAWETAYFDERENRQKQTDKTKEIIKNCLVELNNGNPVQLNWDPDPSDLSLDELRALD